MYYRSDFQEINSFETKLPEYLALKVTKLSVFKPDETQTCLVEDLNLELSKKKNLLIIGRSSSGKTSLMRVMANLWPKISGKFQLQSNHPYFMPQNSYFCQNEEFTLRQQIQFPDLEPDLSREEELKSLISNHGLSHLLEASENNLDVVPYKNWVKKLSPGERQTLAFLRLFYHKPEIAFLDEASSALCVEAEAKLYQESANYGIQLISCGHRPTLNDYHHVILTIGLPNNGWNLTENLNCKLAVV